MTSTEYGFGTLHVFISNRCEEWIQFAWFGEKGNFAHQEKYVPFIRKFAKCRAKFIMRTTLVHLHANERVCMRCRWLFEWVRDSHRSHEKFCLRFMVDRMTNGSVRLFMTFYFSRAVYFHCMVKSFASTPNSIWFSSHNVGEWTELWFYAQHPHEAEFFCVCISIYVKHKYTFNFYELIGLDTIGMKIQLCQKNTLFKSNFSCEIHL